MTDTIVLGGLCAPCDPANPANATLEEQEAQFDITRREYSSFSQSLRRLSMASQGKLDIEEGELSEEEEDGDEKDDAGPPFGLWPSGSRSRSFEMLKSASLALRTVGNKAANWRAAMQTPSNKTALSGRVGLPGVVRMFVTSWNAGGVGPAEMEAGLPEMLPKWIPLGYELYVRDVIDYE